MELNKENVIEWLFNSDIATLTITQPRFKNKIRELVREYPQECNIEAENQDGSILVHIPITWVRIGPPAKRTEKQRESARLSILKNRYIPAKKDTTNDF